MGECQKGVICCISMKHPTPRILVSRCLGYDACRYDGQKLSDPRIETLSKFAEIVTVCPEMDMGMSVPRDPIRIVKQNADFRLIQPSTGKDFTDTMDRFSTSFLQSDTIFDGAILKSMFDTDGRLREVEIKE